MLIKPINNLEMILEKLLLNKFRKIEIINEEISKICIQNLKNEKFVNTLLKKS